MALPQSPIIKIDPPNFVNKHMGQRGIISNSFHESGSKMVSIPLSLFSFSMQFEYYSFSLYA